MRTWYIKTDLASISLWFFIALISLSWRALAIFINVTCWLLSRDFTFGFCTPLRSLWAGIFWLAFFFEFGSIMLGLFGAFSISWSAPCRFGRAPFGPSGRLFLQHRSTIIARLFCRGSCILISACVPTASLLSRWFTRLTSFRRCFIYSFFLFFAVRRYQRISCCPVFTAFELHFSDGDSFFILWVSRILLKPYISLSLVFRNIKLYFYLVYSGFPGFPSRPPWRCWALGAVLFDWFFVGWDFSWRSARPCSSSLLIARVWFWIIGCLISVASSFTLLLCYLFFFRRSILIAFSDRELICQIYTIQSIS